MTYQTWSQYYIPSTKRDLLTALLPNWQGSKTELRQYSIKRLRAIFHTERQRVLRGLCAKSS